MDAEMVGQPDEPLPARIIERGDGETVTNVKDLLLEAWRNRWSEIEFGINVKKVLPRGVSGDVYDLADVILQQSLIGPSPNTVLLSYLVHCINSRIVSYGAVIEAVASINDSNRSECINCLLDLVRSFLGRMGCSGSEEECIRLARSIVKLSSWLLIVLKNFSAQLMDVKNQLPSQAQFPGQNVSSIFASTSNNQKILKVVEKSVDMISFIAESSFLKCLMNIGKEDDPKGYMAMIQAFNDFKEIDTKHSFLSSSFYGFCTSSAEALAAVSQFRRRIDWNDSSLFEVACKQLENGCNLLPVKTRPNDGFAALNCIVAFSAVLNPVSDLDHVASQIFNIAHLYSIPMGDLYCEIIRSCFIGLVDSGDASTTPSSREELRWAAFTFLKTPQILIRLHNMSKSSNSKGGDPQDAFQDIDLGLKKLINLTPLLDLTDCKSNCDCLQLFLNELCKTDLLSESKMSKLVAQRNKETVKSCGLGKSDTASTNQAGSSLILRAEPTVTSILRTLDADYSKNQEGLLGVLCHMVPGKSFELILNAAAATGKLESFTDKLLLFNEFNKQIETEAVGAASHTRALLFDVTFLMLCHISQNYGLEILTKERSSGNKSQDSFFMNWASDSLAKSNQYNSPLLILRKSESSQVDVLLEQFYSDESDFKTSLVKWDEVCYNLAAVMNEVLVAWEQGVISKDDVNKILNNIKSRMCCLPIVVSAWLCSYVNSVPGDDRSKPMELLDLLVTPLPADHPKLIALSGNGDSSTDMLPMYYKERSILMSTIIKKMITDLKPHSTQPATNSISASPTQGLIGNMSFESILQTVFTTALSRSWLDLKCINDMNTLMAVGGAEWFVDSLVRQLVQLDCSDELRRAVGLIFGLFHLDLQSCALALMNKVLPSYLLSTQKLDSLVEPKASSLARLVLVSIFASLPTEHGDMGESSSLKSKGDDVDAEAVHIKPDPDSDNSSGIKPSLIPLFETCPYYIRQQHSNAQRDLLKDPVTKGAANLMLLLFSINKDPEINLRTLFPGIFLEQLILVGKHEAKKLIQFMPLESTLSLIRMAPENISFEYLMALSDLSTSKSRKVTARNLCQLLRAKKLLRTPA